MCIFHFIKVFLCSIDAVSETVHAFIPQSHSSDYTWVTNCNCWIQFPSYFTEKSKCSGLHITHVWCIMGMIGSRGRYLASKSLGFKGAHINHLHSDHPYMITHIFEWKGITAKVTCLSQPLPNALAPKI